MRTRGGSSGVTVVLSNVTSFTELLSAHQIWSTAKDGASYQHELVAPDHLIAIWVEDLRLIMWSNYRPRKQQKSSYNKKVLLI
ncbi:hypothetical protein RRG08_065289 [Elysia crispata]|uniref:Uncharacterized protein n=1 Tax=Elysia crispata TaxID=231223 RepID=A0AAE1D272_9GAST|nr:hypothetical protein RRG08_065289 [Elysia crispata]